MRSLGYMEERGTAYAKATEEMERGYPEPEWVEIGPMMRVILRPHPDFAGSSSGESRATPPSERRTRQDRRPAILEFLNQHPDSDAQKVANGIGITIRQARNYLNGLTEDGQLEETQGPTGRTWSVRGT